MYHAVASRGGVRDFGGLAAGEGLDDTRRATAFGACPTQVVLVRIGAPVLTDGLIRLWLLILSRRLPLARKPVWRMRWKPDCETWMMNRRKGLGADNPAGLTQRRGMGLEGSGGGSAPKEWRRMPACRPGAAPTVLREQPLQDLHRQEEPRAAGDPPSTIRRQPPTRHDDMHVRMVGHGRAPAVQHARHADPGAEMLGIEGGVQERLNYRVEIGSIRLRPGKGQSAGRASR